MSQKIKVQDGNIQYSGVPSDTNPLGEINFDVNGQINVSNEIVVGSINSPIDGVVSTGNGTALERARLDITTGTYGDLSIYQSSTDGKLFLNNSQWPAGAIMSQPGMFVGATDVNKLEYLSFALGSADDSWTVSQLNSTYPNASAGQFVVGTTLLYMCVSTGQWRILGNPPAPQPSGSSPPEFICELVPPGWVLPLFSSGIPMANWNAYVQQTSADVSVDIHGGDQPADFSLLTPGSYVITITARIMSTSYPEGPLPTAAMLYGIQLGGTAPYGNFTLSTHTSGASVPVGYATNGLQNQLQWTDTFYAMMYDTNPVSFTAGVYANTVDGLFEFTTACMISVRRTSGTPIQPV